MFFFQSPHNQYVSGTIETTVRSQDKTTKKLKIKKTKRKIHTVPVQIFPTEYELVTKLSKKNSSNIQETVNKLINDHFNRLIFLEVRFPNFFLIGSEDVNFFVGDKNHPNLLIIVKYLKDLTFSCNHCKDIDKCEHILFIQFHDIFLEFIKDEKETKSF